MKELEEILKECELDLFNASYYDVLEYGRRVHNAALDEAAEKARTKWTPDSSVVIDKASILNLKIEKL